MTPKEKAAELINKFNYFHDKENKEYILFQTPEESKRCALIAVDEILNFRTFLKSIPLEDLHYWIQVKQEIEKL